MLQQPEPDNYVVSSDVNHSVREFCQIAFSRVNLDYRDYVKVDQRFVRPAEVDILLGDSTYTRKKLGWEPKVSFRQLVEMMVDHDLELLKKKHGL